MIKSNFKDNLFYIGVVIFSLTVFLEHLFSIENNFTQFIKGFAVGFQIVGAIVLIAKRRKELK